MVDDDMKIRRRGCRGAPSKARNRKKWIAKIGAAEFAHRMGGPAVAPWKKTVGESVGGHGAATKVVAGEDWSKRVAGASLERSCSVGGAAEAHRGDGSAGSSAQKTVGHGAGGTGATTRVVAGDYMSQSVASAALERLDSVDGVVASVGTETPSGGVEQRDGAVESSPRGGGLQPSAGVTLQQGVVCSNFGGCCDSGDQGSSFSWWVRMETVGLVVLHVCGYVCDDRLVGLALAVMVAVVVAIGVWLRGDAYEATMAAATRRQRAKPLAPGEKHTRVSKKQRMLQCWARVFELMVARGLAGEEARLRQELRQLQEFVFKERERYVGEQGRLRRALEEANKKHLSLLGSWQEEREKVRQLVVEYVKANDLDPSKDWHWKLERGWRGGKATIPAVLQ